LTLSGDLAGYLKMPHAKTVFRLERSREVLGRNAKKSKPEVVYGLSSLPASRITPDAMLAHTRSHWTIENKLHHVRDTTYDEDRSQIRKGSGPQAMAALRNLAISILRLAGATGIARATRFLNRHVKETVRLIGIC
jgi:hypothetical protein